ncbi:MAG: ABC transporter ATP-binding protein [Calditrichaeota bacterium]|nr:MAG: ABC transporter ATP-binding protein [Calditrichota bacterium]
MDNIFLEAEEISKVYHSGEGKIEVLSNLSFEVKKGEFLAIVGNSGIGKSTLLHVLGALDRPSTGTVKIENENIFAKNDKELAVYRNKTMGFIFQFHHLLPEFTAFENLILPTMIHSQKTKATEDLAWELLEKIGLKNRATHKPSELSGGEQQRIAVARALMNRPKLVLADEPSGNLDVKTSNELHNLLKQICKDNEQTFVIVTHDENLASLADRTLEIVNGKIVEKIVSTP